MVDANGWTRRQAFLFIALATIGCGVLGLLIGISLSDSLLSAMPMFFDRSIRLEFLLYPWIMVLLIDAGHLLSQRLDIRVGDCCMQARHDFLYQ